MRTIILSLLSVFSLLAASWWWSWSPQAPPYKRLHELTDVELLYPFRNAIEHDEALARVGNPYVLEINTDSGALLYFGARHSQDPDDPQFVDIVSRWRAFRPTVALCEGRASGYMARGPLKYFSKISDPAAVHRLARSNGVDLFSLEPAYEEEVAELLKRWQPEQVALYFTMRVYWSEAKGNPDERLAQHLLAKRTNVAGLRGCLTTVHELDVFWQERLPDQPDWREMEHEPADTFLAEISAASVQIRGAYMARTLVDLVKRGERVFAVVGSGHVIRQEWALRRTLGAPPAGDEPTD